MILSVRDFTFSYGKKTVLSGVSFDVSSGDVVVLVGANGAGKSTLLKAVARVLKANRNTLFLDEKDILSYAPNDYARRVSYVPQTPTFESSLVLDAVVLGRLPLFTAPSKKDYEAAWNTLETVGIPHLATENVLSLSGGEQQKVALARALCGRSELVLLDEPTSNLDLKSQYGLLNTIKRLSKTGVSFLISVHDVNQAISVGNRFVVLKDRTQLAFGGEEVMSEELLGSTFDLRFEKIYHGEEIHFHIKEKK